MFEYTREVFYYETDKMGVVHHSNYVRWLEESRMAYFNHAGLPYAETEEHGVMIPVTNMNLKFKLFCRFGDTFTVRVRMIKYSGVRFDMAYTVVNQLGQTVLEAVTGHAFVGKDHRPLALPKALPERHEGMARLLEPLV